jgi:uncharacterized MAPEG superfamily protein
VSPELTVLALAGLLQCVQVVLMAIPANRDLGPRYTMGPRDADRAGDLSPLAGRLRRAMANHFEGLILFTLAVVVLELSDRNSNFTESCAWAYLVARIAYVPAYVMGLSPWRSVIWGFGFAATFAMIVAALLG